MKPAFPKREPRDAGSLFDGGMGLGADEPRYRIEFTRDGRRGLSRIAKQDGDRVARAIGDLRTDPRPPGAKALQGMPGLLRIRVGVYWVVYEVQEEVVTILIVRVGHRREVYDRLR